MTGQRDAAEEEEASNASMPEQPPEPRPLSVVVSDDRLSATVSVQEGPAAGERELSAALSLAGVRFGIDPVAFSQLVRSLADPGFSITRQVVARGNAMEAGEDGRFESPFLEGIQPGRLRDDGTIDFHDRELLKPVAKGALIGRVEPARPGILGHFVDGSVEPPPPVKEALLELGSGVEQDTAGNVWATQAGVVVCKTPLSAAVVDSLVHEGPVDLRSGHLHMIGSLLVKGDVQSTFCAVASGDIEVQGNVDNGTIHAGGAVKIQRGIRGNAGTTVRAEGDLLAHHAEFATLYAGGLLRIGDSVHSKLNAHNIEATGKIRGGEARAELGIVVREAGSPQGAQTDFVAGEPLELPIEGALRALEQAKVVRGLRQAGGALRAAPSGPAKGGKLGRRQADLQAENLQRLAERARRRRELSEVAFIHLGLAYPGVTVRIAEKKWFIDGELRCARFSLNRETRNLQMDKAAK